MREREQPGNPVECLAAVWLCNSGKAEHRSGTDEPHERLFSQVRVLVVCGPPLTAGVGQTFA